MYKQGKVIVMEQATYLSCEQKWKAGGSGFYYGTDKAQVKGLGLFISVLSAGFAHQGYCSCPVPIFKIIRVEEQWLRKVGTLNKGREGVDFGYMCLHL